MTATVLKAVLVFVPVGIPFSWSLVSFARAKTAWQSVQLLGAGCLLVVVLTHICEALELYPSMQWGSPNSIGHYLDLSNAVLGLRLFTF